MSLPQERRNSWQTHCQERRQRLLRSITHYAYPVRQKSFPYPFTKDLLLNFVDKRRPHPKNCQECQGEGEALLVQMKKASRIVWLRKDYTVALLMLAFSPAIFWVPSSSSPSVTITMGHSISVLRCSESCWSKSPYLRSPDQGIQGSLRYLSLGCTSFKGQEDRNSRNSDRLRSRIYWVLLRKPEVSSSILMICSETKLS